jgi:hypothetical protein
MWLAVVDRFVVVPATSGGEWPIERQMSSTERMTGTIKRRHQ